MNHTVKTDGNCDGNLFLRIAYGLIGVVAISTNCLILFVHCKVESVRNPPHLIPAIAVSDTLMGIAAFVKVHILGVCDYAFPRRECVLLELPFILSVCTNAPLMLLLSFVRYASYQRPQWVQSYLKGGWFVCLTYGFVFVYAFFGASFHLWCVWDQRSLMEICSLLTATGVYASGRFMLTTLMVICIGITLTNFKLHYVVKKRLQNSGLNAPGSGALRDSRVAQSIIVISLIYLFTFCAGTLGQNLVVYLVHDDRVRAKMAPYFTILLVLNCTTNFFIYASRGSEYRQALKRLFFGQGSEVTALVPAVLK